MASHRTCLPSFATACASFKNSDCPSIRFRRSEELSYQENSLVVVRCYLKTPNCLPERRLESQMMSRFHVSLTAWVECCSSLDGYQTLIPSRYFSKIILKPESKFAAGFHKILYSALCYRRFCRSLLCLQQFLPHSSDFYLQLAHLPVYRHDPRH